MSVFSISSKKYPVLKGIKETEVCIIGGGLAGLNLAYLLSLSNKKVIVLEAETIGHAQSIRSTAKITCLPGFFYHDLIESIGFESSLKVARTMRRALQKYSDLIYHYQINCDFERLPFDLISSDITKIQKEANAMTQLNFHVQVSQKKTCLKEGFVLTLDNQAQIHPGHWMEEISKGLEIYEHSRAVHVEDHDVLTAHGRVHAEHIVFCDHFPFVNLPGFYFMKMHQERSYVLALKNVPKIKRMIYSADEPVESLRFVGNTALYSGFSHATGKTEDLIFEQMKHRSKKLFPESEVIDSWSAQDCMTLDHLPYIGKFSSLKKNWYVSTGFNKWGLIYSMVSAMILHDQICGIHNEDAGPFDSLRSIGNTPINVLKQGMEAISGYYKEFLTVPELKIQDLLKEEGALVEVDGISLGVYRDTDDTYYCVSSRCPHMKCQLTWNDNEKTWDCPCHGSRYDRYGNRIEGPAESMTILLRKEKQV